MPFLHCEAVRRRKSVNSTQEESKEESETLGFLIDIEKQVGCLEIWKACKRNRIE